MEASQLVLPAFATIALGSALLVPLRDDRRGRRATASGGAPLRADFRALSNPPDGAMEAQSVASGVPPRSNLEFGTAVNNIIAFDLAGEDKPEPPEHDSSIPSEAAVARNPRAAKVTEAAWRRIAESWRTLFQTPAASATSLPQSHDTVVERSFAAELDTLLGTPDAAHTAAEPARLSAPRLPDSGAAQGQPADDRVVVRAKQAPLERIVPLTRLPLRPVADDVTWCCPFGIESRDERHALLTCLRSEGSDAGLERGQMVNALATAYREEDAEGRVLALRALERRFRSDAVDTFINALQVGSDEERALAIDALALAHERDALIPAFSDRVEAIAARAAFAYVGTNVRADYVAALQRHVDASRLAAVLGLLAGFIE